MTTILVIAAIYIISIAYMAYEMKNAIDDPADFEESETQPSAASKVKEVDEGFCSNTAAAI